MASQPITARYRRPRHICRRSVCPLVQIARCLACNVSYLAKAVTPKNESKGVTFAKKMTPSKKKNGIPDRWLEYQAVGKRIPGTRFIAFKVPLKQSLNRHVPLSDVFGPWELLDALEKEKQELGLIIDLTFTTRYYKLQDVPESLFCVKIFTAGHEVPSDETILSFKRAVRRFLCDNADNDKLVGVHCTHGLNRTGYLVCRYLIDVDGMDPKEAVELFNSSRGHPIERANYLEDLQSGPKRSNEGMEESEQEPGRGLAVERPRYIPFDFEPREERPPHAYDRYHYRGMDHHPRSPHDGLLPPPLLPLPNFPPPLLPNRPFPPPMAPYRMGPPCSPYQWRPPHPDPEWRTPRPDYQWRRPPHLEESRHRAPHQEERDRKRGHYLPAPPYSALPRYAPSAFPNDEPNDQKTRRSHRHSRRHRD